MVGTRRSQRLGVEDYYEVESQASGRKNKKRRQSKQKVRKSKEIEVESDDSDNQNDQQQHDLNSVQRDNQTVNQTDIHDEDNSTNKQNDDTGVCKGTNSDALKQMKSNMDDLYKMYVELKDRQEQQTSLDEKILNAFKAYDSLKCSKDQDEEIPMKNLKIRTDIPIYSGAQEAKTPFDFLKELEAYKSVVNCNTKEMFSQVLPVALKGEAYSWFVFARDDIISWGDFVTKFRNEFQPVGYYEELKKELGERTQGTREPLTHYIRIILEFYERLEGDYSEKEIVERIINQMHPQYRFLITRSGQVHFSIQELLKEAQIAQESIYRDRQYKEPKAFINVEPSLSYKTATASNTKSAELEIKESSFDRFRHFHKSVPNSFPSITGNINSYSNAQRYANNISQIHKSDMKQAPTPYTDRKFYNAPPSNVRQATGTGFEGKRVRPGSLIINRSARATSQQNYRRNENDPQDENLVIVRAEPIMKVSICNRSFPALLDTGASLSFINKEIIDILRTLNIKTTQCDRTIMTASGSSKIIESVFLTIEWPGGKKRHTLYLLPDLGRPVLLGRDFISSCNIVLDIQGGGWKVGLGNQELVPFSNDNDRQQMIGHEVPSSEHAISTNKHGGEVTLDSSTFNNYPPVPPGASVDARAGYHVHKGAQVNTGVAHKHDKNMIGLIDEVCLVYEDMLLVSDPNTRPEGKNEAAGENSGQVHDKIADLNLPHDQKRRLMELVDRNKALFARTPGTCPDYRHRIITGNTRPIKHNPRPMTEAKRKILRKCLDDFVEKGSVEESSGAWAANPVLAPKANGKWRLCVDYRSLNSVTESDSYCMPRIDEILACLGKAKYISVFDVTDGFHHIVMDDADKNAPASFQRMMDRALGDYKWQFVLAFIDDIIVYSNSFEEHLQHLELVFKRLLEFGFRIHPDKAQFLKNKIKYLGFVIENQTVSPNPEKLKALEGYQQPKNRKDIQRFLGFCGYYRHFIKDFSTIAKPITELLRKDNVFFWSIDAEKAFQTLKTELARASSLKLPDLGKPFIIQTDASDIGIGAILLQEQESILTPVYFHSRTLSQAERNYSTSEKECLAVVDAVKKFRPYIEFTHFSIETDHQALCWLKRLKEPTGRLARWSLELQGFDYEVVYRTGASNRAADALSRAASLYLIDVNSISVEDIRTAQTSDALLGGITHYLRNRSTRPDDAGEQIIKRSSDCALSEEGLLLRYVANRDKPWEDDEMHWRIWLPESLVTQIISYFHNTAISGHLGSSKTYKKIADRFWWKTMKKDIYFYIARCETCQKTKVSHTAPIGIGSSLKITAPWETVAIDLMGPYTRGTNQNQYLLVVVDSFSKWVELFGIRQATSKVIISRLEELFCRWGFPKYIISDNGSQFTSREYTAWCEKLGIKPFYVPPYHPQSNIVERYNQTIKNMIISVINSCKDWDKYLNELAFALRSSVNDSLEYSPAYVNFGRELRYPIDNNIGLPVMRSNANEISDRIAHIQGLVKENMLGHQERHLAAYNDGRRQGNLKVGDKVLLRTFILSNAEKKITSALCKKFEGPYSVVRKRSESIFDLKHIEYSRLYPLVKKLAKKGKTINSGSKFELVASLLPKDYENSFAPLHHPYPYEREERSGESVCGPSSISAHEERNSCKDGHFEQCRESGTFIPKPKGIPTSSSNHEVDYSRFMIAQTIFGKDVQPTVENGNAQKTVPIGNKPGNAQKTVPMGNKPADLTCMSLEEKNNFLFGSPPQKRTRLEVLAEDLHLSDTDSETGD
ncbi:Transposon Ty3-I Gag-Pol polyprotein [Orchesella cincta]|uniref:RNA-directed DNA polymerase n=1 Tax=Orchesella cincta TaxID=48709 RepID=A0A1D2M5N8_ORCCI|nr:Transposon Ty3-I Gag-Pol polyprotein [Orchesella cincta]